MYLYIYSVDQNKLVVHSVVITKDADDSAEKIVLFYHNATFNYSTAGIPDLSLKGD